MSISRLLRQSSYTQIRTQQDESDLPQAVSEETCKREWRDKPRPILINNWEATYFDFTREKLIAIAQKAKECGVELFVLDDGWFGARTTDHAGLGRLGCKSRQISEGITGIAEDIEKVGLEVRTLVRAGDDK